MGTLVKKHCLYTGLYISTGDGEARGVEGQVGQLLAEACDPGLLCMMYVGWAPWL